MILRVKECSLVPQALWHGEGMHLFSALLHHALGAFIFVGIASKSPLPLGLTISNAFEA